MRKKIAVIGLGHFGLNLCLHLMQKGAEVLAIDISEDRVELLRDRVSHAMVLDTTDLKALRNLGLNEMTAVVVAIGEDFESSILTTAHLQELKVKKIINRVVSPVHERLLKLMNITDLVLPESEAAYQTANRLTMTGVLECLELTEDYSIVEVNVPKSFVGKTLVEVDLRKRFNLNLVTVIRRQATKGLLTLGERPDVQVLGVPTNDFKFSADDILVVFGQEKSINSLSELK